MVKLKYDSLNKKWIKLPPNSKEGIYYDGFIFNTFAKAKSIMKRKDVDLPIAVSGYPGSGKSTLVAQIAHFCDPTFTYKRMYQNAEQFIEAVKTASVGQAHVLDESYKDLNPTEMRREIGRAIMNVMNIIRQKRLYIFILLPNFFDLHKSIAVFRTRWLLHCYSENFGDIGRFCAFDRNTKQQLYVKGKRFEDYNVVKADFFGSFRKKIDESFDWESYKKIKDAELQNVFVKTEKVKRAVKQRDYLIYLFNKKHNYTPDEITEITGLGIRIVYDIIKREKERIEDEKLTPPPIIM